MDHIHVATLGPLRGAIRPPGDKSVSHRALILAALADGASELRGLSSGDDVRRTAAAIAALGAEVRTRASGPARTWDAEVVGGRHVLREATAPIDVGNSGTAIRLLAGVCAGLPGLTVLHGDASIGRRPMDRVVEPLRAMGASVDGRDGGRLAPLAIRGGGLRGVRHELAVASAQVKSALLLAGLSAEGETTVVEPAPTRAHTEEMLVAAGADIARVDEVTTVVRRSEPASMVLDVPADPSQAAFWAVAASLVPGSEVALERVYVGRARAGFLDVLERMGAQVERRHHDDVTADLVVRSAAGLAATEVAPFEVPGLVDEIPVLAVAAAFAGGTTTFCGVGELRVKESDRLATTSAMVRALGGRCDVDGDRLVVHGTGGALAGGATVRSEGDHRIAMAAAVAALACRAPVRIEGWSAVATSYPGFEEDLRTCAS